MRRLEPARESWICARETREVMGALDAASGASRFVGGALRNALLGLPVEDIDIATILRPQEVVRRLEAAGIKALPTGLAHGTVTAVFATTAFEITTLRRDVATDGRHAVVAFTDDWRLDAQRRDFTINALYAAPDGEIFDYTGGIDDLAARRVRFIGDPIARIREDYLRILRLFRFHAWYGRGPIDADALAAVHGERAGLRQLSGERIRNEFLRLLGAADPCPAIRAMRDAAVLTEIIPGEAQFERFEHLVRIEAAHAFAADVIRRLAALIANGAALSAAIADRFRLSNEDRNRMAKLAAAGDLPVFSTSPRELRVLLYRQGAQRTRDRILLRWAEEEGDSHAFAWRALLEIAQSWNLPRFPLSGEDVLTANIPEGPQIGRILRELEDWWIANDFAPDRAETLKRLSATAAD